MASADISKHIHRPTLLAFWLLLLGCLPCLGQTVLDDGVDEAKVLRIFSVLMPENKAKEHIRKVRELAAKTPYSANRCLGISHRWMLWEWTEQDILKGLQAGADAAASVSGDEEVFSQISLTIGNLRVEEGTYPRLLQLENSGIPVFQVLGKLVGKTPAEVRQYSRQEQLKPSLTAELLIKGFADAFQGVAAAELLKNGKK